MKTKISPAELYERLEKFCDAHTPPGRTRGSVEFNPFKPIRNWHVELAWDLAWRIDCRIRFEPVKRYIEIQWSMLGGYDPATAICASKLHLAVAEFACLLQCWLEKWDTQGWPARPEKETFNRGHFVKHLQVG